jgi:hypothetical protein
MRRSVLGRHVAANARRHPLPRSSAGGFFYGRPLRAFIIRGENARPLRTIFVDVVGAVSSTEHALVVELVDAAMRRAVIAALHNFRTTIAVRTESLGRIHVLTLILPSEVGAGL